MGRPIWITKAGDLGVKAERKFFSIPLEVTDPDNEPLTFSIVGGDLPRGVSLSADGSINGVPSVRKAFVGGVPLDISEDVTSTFAVRARTQTGHVSDRTFFITISGQDIPELLTPTEVLGTVYDGEYFEYQLSAVDLDDEKLTWSIKDGALPTGLTLNPDTGLISGFVGIVEDVENGAAGWNNTAWDSKPWDLLVQTIDKNYQFTVAITDGKDFAIRTYYIYVISKDSTDEDGDGDTFEIAVRRHPVIFNQAGDIGIYLHDNYFAYKFDGYDFDGDPVNYYIEDEEQVLPPGLSIGTETGWLHGYLEPQPVLEREFEFTVTVKKRNYPQWTSSKTFKMTVAGDLGKYIQWISPTNLGTIENGGVSEFKVEATNGLGRTLFYRLADDFSSRVVEYTVSLTASGSQREFALGYDVTNRPLRVFKNGEIVENSEYVKVGTGGVLDSILFDVAPGDGSLIVVEIETGGITTQGAAGKLPQGLKVLPDGSIVGRVSFNGFSFDGGTTTFDKVQRVSYITAVETTFDQQFRFSITAYDLEGDIEVRKEFIIRIDFAHTSPYDDLYGVALLDAEDRRTLSTLLTSNRYFPSDALYRPFDTYFGVAKDIRMLLASGIMPVQASELQAALSRNHYNKRIYLGDIKTARALNDDGSVRYEVVYLEVLDDRVNKQGQSISPSIQLGNVSISQGYEPVIYPNSLVNMRNAIYGSIDQVNKSALPAWMLSKQEDGTIPGFMPAVVLCYTIPGKSKELAFNLKRNDILDFANYEVILDRYIWDCNMSQFYNTETDEFLVDSETTFDKFSVDTNRYRWVATVDYATDLAFSQINGKTVSEVIAMGGLDGNTDILNKTFIFFRQEAYSGIPETDTGWEVYIEPFDASPFDFDPDNPVGGGVFDRANQVPLEQRTSVWRLVSNDGEYITLEPVQQVNGYERVDVRSGGINYGGKRTFLDPVIEFGSTQPAFRLLEDAVPAVQTTFDGNGTRFFSFKDKYAELDENDKYIKFPQYGVFE